ncbi:U5 small nuclear ribonucleoprotein TSSC4 [Ochotona princeps]|uniref:U5 small nuclear ribonucleoprotein TSSC4 n=1 Tax=Ochotona princeps TaxID=9978 RepID=UPI0027149D1B|nr:U5 small nuclear ribonucleoprotein TSSC4 [Ochotona princeps]
MAQAGPGEPEDSELALGRPFRLRGQSSAFAQRSHSVFDGLDAPGPPPRDAAPRLPDYLVHPERWTKYSLEDVAVASERGNREAALAFLGARCSPASAQEPRGRVLFTRPARPERKRPPAQDAAPGPVELAHLAAEASPEAAEASPGQQREPRPPGSPVRFHGARKRSRQHLRCKGSDREGPAEEA